jgi:peptidoglycan/LPS O-acetylase OafA/YrhL
VFQKFANKVDLSYGIYLYGFFFQQLIVQYTMRKGINPGFLAVLTASIIPTGMAAIASFYLVEKPVQACSRWMTEQLTERQNKRSEL